MKKTVSKNKVGVMSLAVCLTLAGCGGDEGQVIVIQPTPEPTQSNIGTLTELGNQIKTLTTQRDNAQTELQTAQSELEKLKQNPTNQADLDKAKADLQKAQTELQTVQNELKSTKQTIEELKAKIPTKPEPSSFFEALKKSDGFKLDGTGTMEGKMESFRSNHEQGIFKQYYNGVVLTLDDSKTKADNKIAMSQTGKNARSTEDELNVFKLSDDIEVTLTDLQNRHHFRALKAEDFSKGSFTGKGFVGGSGEPSSYANKQSDIRYGVYSQEGQSILFVNGKPAGRAIQGTYVGNAFYGKNGDYKALKNAVTAIVSLTDDQNSLGRIDVNVNVGGGEILNLGGEVSGNVFEGNAGDGEIKGGFFGLGDAAGVFYVNKAGEQNGYNGVFGVSNK